MVFGKKRYRLLHPFCHCHGGAFAGGWGVATLYLLLSRPIIKHKILIGIGSIVSSAVLSLILSVILAALFQSLGLI